MPEVPLQIADIDLPVSPSLLPLFSIAILLFLTLFIVWIKNSSYFSSRKVKKPLNLSNETDKCATRIETIKTDLESKRIDTRRAAYLLATILRKSLKLKQLTSQCPASFNGTEKQWKKTLVSLNTCRYQLDSNMTLSHELFEVILINATKRDQTNVNP